MNPRTINKILIANRGEIAVRIIRTLKTLHINSVAVFADNDSQSLHCRMADEARPLGSGNLSETYLNIQKIIDAALDSGAQAIHPGYGFLSENPDFAEACTANNLIFIGPDAETIRLMGNKIDARNFAIANNIPLTKGFTQSPEELLKNADNLPYPILIKAAAGGGGKGMHIVRKPSELAESLEKASREAQKYFGNNSIFVEQYIEKPRHIEFQILADHFGNVIHLFERECSIQRRYQKIIEESPSPSISEKTRMKMGEVAKDICRKAGYKNAGTVEFLVDKDQNFYFLEMNTRIQVEHPVTEQLTGIDIVEEQIRIASGKQLSYQQEDVTTRGHAIECRIYAENPEKNFLPSPGKITLYSEPKMRGVRVDSGIDTKCLIPECYDPMISKLICFGKDRQQAIEIARHALSEYIIQGIKTNNAFLQELLSNQLFIDNKICTSFCEEHKQELLEAVSETRKNIPVEDIIAVFLLYDFNKTHLKGLDESVWEEIGYWRYHTHVLAEAKGRKIPVNIDKTRKGFIRGSIDGKCFEIQLIQHNSNQLKIMLNDRTETVYISETCDNNTIVHLHGQDFVCRRGDQLNDSFDYSLNEEINENMGFFSPMPGKVMKINVKEGDVIERGKIMLIIEAMKMENNIVAPTRAKVEKINVKENQMVDTKTQLIFLKELPKDILQ